MAYIQYPKGAPFKDATSFLKWFNPIAAGSPAWRQHYDKSSVLKIYNSQKFLELFADPKVLGLMFFGDENANKPIPFKTFLGMFVVQMNETGGFQAFVELGDMAYIINPKSGVKQSYNAIYGNEPAGDQVKKAYPQLSNEERRQLNSRQGISQALINKYLIYLKECDAWRYKGVGLIGITFKGNWAKTYFPIFQRKKINHLLLPTDQLHRMVWSTPSILAEACFNYFQNVHPQALPNAFKGDAGAIPLAVSGGLGWYKQLAMGRVHAVLSALKGVDFDQSTSSSDSYVIHTSEDDDSKLLHIAGNDHPRSQVAPDRHFMKNHIFLLYQ
jgi:predicted chitinase